MENKRNRVAKNGYGVNVATLTTNLTLTSRSAKFQKLTASGGNRNAVLPALAKSKALWFVIANGGLSNSILVKDPDTTTLATLAAGQACLVACNGSTNWHVVMTGPTSELTDFGNGGLLTDVVDESTAAAGVTVDGVLLKDAEVTTDVIHEKTGAAGVTVDGCLIKDGRAAALATAAMFLSAEITGNGSSQDTAHGLGATPTLVFAIPSDLSGGAYTVAYGTHDGTNCKVTVTTGEKYRVVAFK
jgi:hypothetical protein